MSDTVEQRLSRLEKEFAQLKSQSANAGERSGWISDVTGSFQDDPEFDEILRLGREIREAERSETGDPVEDA